MRLQLDSAYQLLQGPEPNSLLYRSCAGKICIALRRTLRCYLANPSNFKRRKSLDTRGLASSNGIGQRCIP